MLLMHGIPVYYMENVNFQHCAVFLAGDPFLAKEAKLI